MIVLNFECWLIVYGNANLQKYFKTASDLHRYKYCVLMIPFHCVNQSPEDTMTSKELIQGSPPVRLWFIYHANTTHHLLMNMSWRWERSTNNLTGPQASAVAVLSSALHHHHGSAAANISMLFPMEMQILEGFHSLCKCLCWNTLKLLTYSH